VSCGQTNSNESKTGSSVPEEAQPTDIAGSYVSDGYDRKAEGYDWVAVLVERKSGDMLDISIRSRADKKKPTCFMNADAEKVNDKVYRAMVDYVPVLFTFEGGNVTISAERPGDGDRLHFYCSGGATVAGTYAKIEGPIDLQVDKRTFTKGLNLQDVFFSVEGKMENGKNLLTVEPVGLERGEPFSLAIEGEIVNAEVEDLNADGSPELVVYTKSGPNEKGHVYGFSTLGKKSMVQINFPQTDQNSRINEGYNGFDTFTLIETYLGQRFPIFEMGQRTPKMRDIVYKMEKGEAMPQFVIMSVTDNLATDK
jgi:hypothetical protein